MSFHIDIQNHLSSIPITQELIKHWASTALQSQMDSAELSICIIDSQKMTQLNHQYRQQNKPTNVLSFPSALPDEIMRQLEHPFIGDILICPEVLLLESQEQKKDLEYHWAHIIVHGVLHLMGYDHIEDADAKRMQSLESQILHQLNYPNPYENDEI